MSEMAFRILIVDDKADNLFTLRSLLSRLPNCVIVDANSGEAALVATLEYDIHLILLDIQMPGMDGFETAGHLQMTGRTRDIPIIFLTAVFKAEAFSQRGYAVGAVDYLTKPIDENLLLNRIRIYQRLAVQRRSLLDVENRLKLSSQALNAMSEGVMILDAAESIVSVNPAFLHSTGYCRDEVIDRKASLLTSGRHDRAFFDAMRNKLKAAGNWQGEIWNRRKDGGIYPEWLNANAIRSPAGRITHYVCIYSDLSSQEHIRKRLQRLAYYDELTGLPNRELFRDRLINTLVRAQREGKKAGLMFLDLDRFKAINDTLGHSVGDLLLQAVAGHLKQLLRESDTVARLGGDEFTVILYPVGDIDQIALVASKILLTLDQPFGLEGHTIHSGASIGISVFPNDGDNYETLLRNADAAMYRAKESGRNNYQFYSEELTTKALDRFVLETDLRLAIQQKQLRMVYQPLVDLVTHQIIGAEALMRWEHPRLGHVAPDKFIPIAEESGLIIDIDAWGMAQACRQLRLWLQAGYSIQRVAVNISGYEIERSDLVGTTRRILKESELPPQCLELEISERFIMAHSERSRKVLDGLNALGVGLAIDDFGTGYSSLSHLKRLPISRLKIDRAFVKDIPEDANDAAISRAVIALGKSMGLSVIAEGIEHDAQALFLRTQGCDEGQGYLFGRPSSAQEFTRWLEPLPDETDMPQLPSQGMPP
jgi:diguanylate cyclase (GGDEF)-like protein/PAS domain S-box-containing protein